MAEDAKGFNEGADRVVAIWQDDWKGFFADVCRRTGLSLQEAMIFHTMLSSHVSSQAAGFLASKMQGLTVQQMPKEPWEE